MPFDNATFNEATLAGLIAWLERQPTDGRYEYCSGTDCLMCQWLSAATGERIVLAAMARTPKSGGYYGKSPMTATYNVRDLEIAVATSFPHTYGGALKRARNLAAQSA